jgi:hypothetical protein
MAAAPASRKAAWTTAVALVVVIPPLLGYLSTSRHVITIRNRSAVALEGMEVLLGDDSRGIGFLAPGHERVLDFEQSVTVPYVITRGDGKARAELGQCEHTIGHLNRTVVTISGDHGERLECVVQAP